MRRDVDHIAIIVDIGLKFLFNWMLGCQANGIDSGLLELSQMLVELFEKLAIAVPWHGRDLQDLIKSERFLARFLADVNNVGSLGIGCVAWLGRVPEDFNNPRIRHRISPNSEPQLDRQFREAVKFW